MAATFVGVTGLPRAGGVRVVLQPLLPRDRGLTPRRRLPHHCAVDAYSLSLNSNATARSRAIIKS